MKFSFIIPTLNRLEELERMFHSLAAQAYQDFEVIVVDQNRDDRLVGLVRSYQAQFPIFHIRETKQGQSRARNIGFKKIQGDIVAFPDDDCVYPDELLTKIANFFKHNLHWDGLLTRVFALDSNDNAFERCGENQSQELDFVRAYKNGVSAGIFFRKPVVEKVIFDETMGPGSGTPWGCGDDTDFLFQCLQNGYRFYYDANIFGRHPNPRKIYTFGQLIRREYAYGLGNGHFLAKHNLSHSLFKTTTFSYPFYQLAFKECLRGNLQRASYHLMHGLGTWQGYKAGLKIHQKTEEINN